MGSFSTQIVRPARAFLRQSTNPSKRPWALDNLAGRFIEITSAANTASLSAAVPLILQAQQRGLLTAWIAGPRSLFFPPDLADAGIDLAALPVIRVQDTRKAPRIADALLRSGSFALVLIDLGGAINLSLSAQTRLGGLAKQHNTAFICITRQTQRRAPRLPQVSLRVTTKKSRTGHHAFTCELHALKDKCRTPDWTQKEDCHGSGGLC